MRNRKELLIILLIALILRIAPVMLNEMPVLYDAPFHINSAQKIIDSEALPGNGYPPFYHLELFALSSVSGFSVFEITKFFLPVSSVLIILMVFLFARKFFSQRAAIYSSLIFSIAFPLISASFDSPEVIVLVLLFLGMWLLNEGKMRFSSIIFSSMLYWNYFSSIIIYLALFLSKRKEKYFLKKFINLLAIFSLSGFYFGLIPFKAFNLTSGTEFVKETISIQLIEMILISIALLAFFGHYYLKNKYSMDFWFHYFLISFIGSASILLTPLLRAWEFGKFLVIAFTLMFLRIENSFIKKTAVPSLILIFFLASFFVSFQYLYPVLNKVDLNSIEFLNNHYSSGKILASPALTSFIEMNSEINSFATAQFFEIRNEKLFNDSLRFLSADRELKEEIFLKENEISLHLRTFEDNKLREREFNGNHTNKIYELKYEVKCLFPELNFLSVNCGKNRTQIYEFI